MVHSGIRTAALQLKQRIEPTLIDEILRTNARHLFITGHSLGAGTASLLALMLRELIEADARFVLDVTHHAEHEDANADLQHAMPVPEESAAGGKPAEKRHKLKLHCYAFGPPPIVSLNLASRAEGFVSAFVTDADVVCRLCYGTIMDLRSMVIAAIEVGNGDIWVEKRERPSGPTSEKDMEEEAEDDGMSRQTATPLPSEEAPAYTWHFRWQEKQAAKERDYLEKQERKAERKSGFFRRVSAAYSHVLSPSPPIPENLPIGAPNSRGRTPDRGNLEPLARDETPAPGTRAAQLVGEAPRPGSTTPPSRASSRSSSMRHLTRQRKKKMTKKGEKIISESDAFESLRTARQWILDDPHKNPKVLHSIFHIMTTLNILHSCILPVRSTTCTRRIRRRLRFIQSWKRQLYNTWQKYGSTKTCFMIISQVDMIYSYLVRRLGWRNKRIIRTSDPRINNNQKAFRIMF